MRINTFDSYAPLLASSRPKPPPKTSTGPSSLRHTGSRTGLWYWVNFDFVTEVSRSLIDLTHFGCLFHYAFLFWMDSRPFANQHNGEYCVYIYSITEQCDAKTAEFPLAGLRRWAVSSDDPISTLDCGTFLHNRYSRELDTIAATFLSYALRDCDDRSASLELDVRNVVAWVIANFVATWPTDLWSGAFEPHANRSKPVCVYDPARERIGERVRGESEILSTIAADDERYLEAEDDVKLELDARPSTGATPVSTVPSSQSESPSFQGRDI